MAMAKRAGSLCKHRKLFFSSFLRFSLPARMTTLDSHEIKVRQATEVGTITTAEVDSGVRACRSTSGKRTIWRFDYRTRVGVNTSKTVTNRRVPRI
jgi:hypothetical protein